MNKKQRSLANSRSEAQRIYYQRKEIKRLKKENKYLDELRNANYLCWQDCKLIVKKAAEITKDLKQFVYDELVDRNVSGATEIYSKIIDLSNILNDRR